MKRKQPFDFFNYNDKIIKKGKDMIYHLLNIFFMIKEMINCKDTQSNGPKYAVYDGSKNDMTHITELEFYNLIFYSNLIWESPKINKEEK